MNMRTISLMLFTSLSFLPTCTKKEKPTPPPTVVTAFQVEPKTIPATFEFVGVLKSSHPVQIRSRVEGYLQSIDYEEGSLVKKGDRLFQIDPRLFAAALKEAEGELARQEAILWGAKKSLERIEPLYKKNAASQRDLDDATTKVLSAEASVISAKGNLEKAALNLSFTKITAPIEGMVGKALHREGDLIMPMGESGLLAELSVLDPIWVYFSLTESQILMKQSGESEKKLILPPRDEYTVELILADNTKYPYTGRVNFAAPILDPATGTMMVRAEFQNPRGVLLPGEFVQAIVSGAQRPNAIFVPQQSVFQGRNGMYVFVIDTENKVSSRLVQTGNWFENYWIITQGLQPGEVVVADGINKIHEGDHVDIQKLLSPNDLQKG